MVRATIVGNVGNVSETKTGKTRFSVATGSSGSTVWYNVIGEVEKPEVGARVEVTGDLLLSEPYNGKSQATLFLSPSLRVIPKRNVGEFTEEAGF